MIDFRGAAYRILDGRLRQNLKPFEEADWAASAIVFAPHPDDETLGCGGIAHKKITRGAQVRFVFITDGAKSHSKNITPEALTSEREREALEAVLRLGAKADDATFLRFPDGSAAYHIEAITAAIGTQLRTWQPDSIFVNHMEDPPSDHAAVNSAVRIALGNFGSPVTVYEYPIWFWYHWPWVRMTGDTPGMWRTTLRQTLRTRGGLRVFSALNRQAYVGDVLEVKRAALAAHVSQTRRPQDCDDWATLEDLSGGDFVARLLADYETFHCYEANA